MRAERCSEGVAICKREVQLVGLSRKREVERRKGRMRIAHEGEGYLCSSHVGELLPGEENSW
jgi:hypothetical protein